jgi:hypothetical protein
MSVEVQFTKCANCVHHSFIGCLLKLANWDEQNSASVHLFDSLQRWASTLANRSNARHRSNIRAPPPAPPQMYVSKVWESVRPEGAGSDS